MASRWQPDLINKHHPRGTISRRVVGLAGWLGFRERYVLTRYKTPRIRYLLMPVAFMLVAYGADTIAEARIIQTGIQNAVQYTGGPTQSGGPQKKNTLSAPIDIATVQNEERRKSTTSPSDTDTTDITRTSRRHLASNGYVVPPSGKPEPQSITRTRTIGEGDTIAGILAGAGMTHRDAYRAVKAMKEHYNPRALRPGQDIQIKLKPGEEQMDVAAFRVSINPARIVQVARTDRDDFKAQFEEKQVHRELHAKQITISGSLYGSAERSDIPAPVISKAIHVFSWDIDFQRDLRRGDKLKILYARHVTEDGVYTGNGTVIHAALDLGEQDIAAYRYESEDGKVGYFKPDGHSVRKALMTTPVDGARISSGYGKRKHPVLGYSKMHEGVDFAAPTGTPVYAAGDGVIEKASRNGGYGNYISMRHNARLKTAYAHLNRYADNIDPGQRVEQGEVIGYIGSTGRSTGPHLHYEVMENGEPVNPQDLDMPTGEILEGETLKDFKERVEEIETAYKTHNGDIKYAARDSEKTE